ncbi:hypothetical protein KIM372_03300 [Bombiscardovia nodaiensis]|uniref:Uncharacterized protein n=1 Tax=Bombiscardovia nodaiensis TaxID=2932181 RepID=A0ABN6SAC1_9BIFI|nr:hypothetical protein KIM372_03300 [Bombiscardovia nodaiensis]
MSVLALNVKLADLSAALLVLRAPAPLMIRDKAGKPGTEQRVRDGKPLFAVTVCFPSRSFDGDELVPVSVKVPLSAEEADAVQTGSRVILHDPSLSSGEFRGNAFLAFSAVGLELADGDGTVSL